MTAVPLGDYTIATLIAANRMVAVSDQTGKVVGFFAPVILPLAAEYTQAAAQIYPHKDDHKATPPGRGYTSAEVAEFLRYLEAKYGSGRGPAQPDPDDTH